MTARVKAGKVRRFKVDGRKAAEHKATHGRHPTTRACGTARRNYHARTLTRGLPNPHESRPKPRLVSRSDGPDYGWWPDHLRLKTRIRRAKNRRARLSRRANR